MSLQKLTRTAFNGGIANDSKSGLPNAARFTRFLDIHSDSDSVTLMPKPAKISSTTVVDLPKWMVEGRPYDTNRYAYGSAGHLYKISSSDVVTDLRTAPLSDGQGLIVFEDSLYYATETAIGRYSKLSSTPAFNDDYFSDDVYNLDQANTTASGQTYTLPIAISESATNQFAITVTKTPMSYFRFTCIAKGTGTITLTIHDVDNNVLFSLTKLNAAFGTGIVTFNLVSQVKALIGKDYHVHLTSSVADTTFQTSVNADLSTVWFKEFFSILFYDIDYHPMILHTNGVTGIVAIGNGNYIATYDGDTYNPNKIALEPGYKVRGWTRENEFIVAYCWKGDTISDYEEGKAFYWDGISPYYNYAKPVMGGQPNAMISTKNRVFSILGNRGAMALGTEPFRKLQPSPQLARGKSVEVMPGAIAVWQDRVYFGVGNTDDALFEQGVYEFGTDSDRAISYQSVSTEVLNYAFRTSPNDTTGTDQKIGMLFPTGQALYIGWKNGSTYGIDKVGKDSASEVIGSWESQIIDVGVVGKSIAPCPQKTKQAVKLVITFDALPTGCTVTPKFRMDRATSFTTGTAAVATSRRAELTFSNVGVVTRYKEIEIGFDIVSTGSYPTITGLFYTFDALENEVDES